VEVLDNAIGIAARGVEPLGDPTDVVKVGPAATKRWRKGTRYLTRTGNSHRLAAVLWL